jgi:hypothetical protein
MRKAEPPAVLRREIQHAGATAGLIRAVLLLGRPAGVAMLVGGFFLAVSLGIAVPWLGESFLSVAGGWAWFLLAVTCVLASACAVPVARAYRRIRQEQLRWKLAHLPREQLAEVLLPLQDYEYADTRQIVQPLIRELRPGGTEVAPASAPEGSGREPAPPGPSAG